MAGAVVSQLCILLASLAAGLFPEAMAPNIDGLAPQTLPVLQCLAVGQAAFLLLVWPLAARAQAPVSLVSMLAMSLLISLPAYVLAAVVSDATIRDVVRTVVYVLLLWPLAFAAARWLCRPAGRSVVLLGLLIASVGLPAGYYIVREFVAASPLGPVEWIWQLGPLTAAWDVAASRAGLWTPEPLWAALVWPIAAAALLVIEVCTAGTRRTDDPVVTP